MLSKHIMFSCVLHSPSLLKEFLSCEEEEDDTASVLHRHRPEGGIVVEVFCHDTAEQTTDTET